MEHSQVFRFLLLVVCYFRFSPLGDEFFGWAIGFQTGLGIAEWKYPRHRGWNYLQLDTPGMSWDSHNFVAWILCILDGRGTGRDGGSKELSTPGMGLCRRFYLSLPFGESVCRELLG